MPRADHVVRDGPPVISRRAPPPQTLPTTIPRGSHVGLPRRTRTDRQQHISLDQVTNLVNAILFADALGDPLIVHMTVIWSHFAGYDEGSLGPLTSRFFDKITKWHRTRGIVFKAVWTRERGENKGHHLHVLMNTPIEYIRDLQACLKLTFGITNRGLCFTYGEYGMFAKTMRMGALRYLIKSIDPLAFKYHGYEPINHADALGIKHPGRLDGRIENKRAGWTQNIGPTARKRAEWRELRTIEELREALHPEKEPRPQRGGSVVVADRAAAAPAADSTAESLTPACRFLPMGEPPDDAVACGSARNDTRPRSAAVLAHLDGDTTGCPAETEGGCAGAVRASALPGVGGFGVQTDAPLLLSPLMSASVAPPSAWLDPPDTEQSETSF